MKKTIRSFLILAAVIICSIGVCLTAFASETVSFKDPDVTFEIPDDYTRNTSYETDGILCNLIKQTGEESYLGFTYNVYNAYDEMDEDVKKVYSRSDFNTSIYEDKKFRDGMLSGMKESLEESLGSSGEIVGDLSSDLVTVDANKFMKITYSILYKEANETNTVVQFIHVNEGIASYFTFKSTESEISDKDINEILKTVTFENEVEGTTYISSGDFQKKSTINDLKSILSSGIGRGILFAIIGAIVAGIAGFIRKRKNNNTPKNQFQPDQFQPEQYQPNRFSPDQTPPMQEQPGQSPAETGDADQGQSNGGSDGSEF